MQKPANKVKDDTRHRLLDAAEELFAQKGYAAVSVREITNQAGTHLSAVNYHFGGKRKLYLGVFQELWLPRAQQIYQALFQASQKGPMGPDEVIRTLAKALLQGQMNERVRQRHHQLIAREMAQPTEAYDLILNKAQRPLFELMVRLLQPHLPPGLPMEQMGLYIFSIFAQVLHANFARTLVSRLMKQPYNQKLSDSLVEHIVQFSLKGMGINHQESKK